MTSPNLTNLIFDWFPQTNVDREAENCNYSVITEFHSQSATGVL